MARSRGGLVEFFCKWLTGLAVTGSGLNGMDLNGIDPNGVGLRSPRLSVLGSARPELCAARLEAHALDCPSGKCPLWPQLPALAENPGRSGTTPELDAACRAAIVRIRHECGRAVSLGSGTLVDVNTKHGLILTCGHLFAGSTGRVVVLFHDGQSYEARLLEALDDHDLAALLIRKPVVEPLVIGRSDPVTGELVVAAGYGPRGQFAATSGQAVGLTHLVGQRGDEVLELTGSGRPGDSGGPVLNGRGELVGVQWGSDGRTIDATCLARVRWFLARHSQRFRPASPATDPPVLADLPAGGRWQHAPPNQPSSGPAPSIDGTQPIDGAQPDNRAEPAASASPNTPAAPASPVAPAWPQAPSPAAARRASAAEELARLRQRLRELEARLAASPAAPAVEQWATTRVIALAAGVGVPGWMVALVIWLLRRRVERRRTAPTPRPMPPAPTPAGLSPEAHRLPPAGEPGAAAWSADDASARHLPEPIVVRKEARPPPQLVERDREFVEVQVTPIELTALQWAMDELVRRNPGARTFVETVEAFASQYASGLKQRRAA